jgi:NAD+ synthase (glutamine-hydrolysing)
VQKTEDLIGPYELTDFYLYYLLRFGMSPEKILYLAEHAFEGVYSEEEQRKWMCDFIERFFRQQFKRSCMPNSPKVGSVCLSPRGDWRMPSDACAALWLEWLDVEERAARIAYFSK